MNNKNVKPQPDEADILVGKRLRILRNMAGISQNDLAIKTGITFQQIQKYEKGANRISASRLFKFSQLLGVDVDDFYSDLSKIKNSNNPLTSLLNFNAPLDKNTIELIGLFQKIHDKSTKKTLLNLLRSYVKNCKEE